jgi:anti-sigma regulatory factor (Ser/Thr protein kinase)
VRCALQFSDRSQLSSEAYGADVRVGKNAHQSLVCSGVKETNTHATPGYNQHFLYGVFNPADMNTSMDTAVCIRRTEHLRLPALVSSVAGSRLFVRQTCKSWQMRQEQIDDAQLLASELVSNAILASGATEPRSTWSLPYADSQLIGLRLLALDGSLVIEVWDSSPRSPKLIERTDLLEHGRGLQLVDALSIRWGHYPRIGGKVVWCQLALDADVYEHETDEVETYKRVTQALEAYPWDEHA